MKRDLFLRRNIVLYRIILVLGRNGLLTSVMYFFLTDVKSFTASQALFLISLALISVAITEVPTGVVADKVSRKLSIVVGYILLSLGWLGILFSGQFWQFIVLTIIRGIGGSFLSGADDALLYDSLKEMDSTSEYKRIYNQSKSIELVGFAITIFVGGILANIDLAYPIILNIILIIASIILSLLFTEPDVSESGEKIAEVGYITHTVKSLKALFSKSGIGTGLFVIFMSTALINAVFKSTKIIVAPFLDALGVNVLEISLVITLIILIKALGAYIGSKLNKQGGEIREIKISLLICVIGLCAITIIGYPIVQLIIFVFIIGLDNIILSNLSTLLNERIASRYRSTMLSMNSLFARSAEMFYLTTFGWILDVWTQEIAIVFTSVWLLIVLVLFSFISLSRLVNEK